MVAACPFRTGRSEKLKLTAQVFDQDIESSILTVMGSSRSGGRAACSR
jgi:hypothetical protein